MSALVTLAVYAGIAVALMGAVSGTYLYVKDKGVKECEAKQKEKDDAIAEMQRQWAASEQKRLDEEDAARRDAQAKFNAGLAAGRRQRAAQAAKGANDAANDIGINNPQCVMSADSLRNLNAALVGPNGLQAAANSPGTARPASVPAADANAGRQVRDGASEAVRSGGPVLGVQGAEGSTGGASQTGRTMVQQPQRAPSPIKR